MIKIFFNIAFLIIRLKCAKFSMGLGLCNKEKLCTRLNEFLLNITGMSFVFEQVPQLSLFPFSLNFCAVSYQSKDDLFPTFYIKEGTLTLNWRELSNKKMAITKSNILFCIKQNEQIIHDEIELNTKNLIINFEDKPHISGELNLNTLNLDLLFAQKYSTNAHKNVALPNCDFTLNIEHAIFKNFETNNVHMQVTGPDVQGFLNMDGALQLAVGGAATGLLKYELATNKMQLDCVIEELQIGPVLQNIQALRFMEGLGILHLNLVFLASQQALASMQGEGKLEATKIYVPNGISIPTNNIIKSLTFKDFNELVIPFSMQGSALVTKNAYLVGDGIAAVGTGVLDFVQLMLDLDVNFATSGANIPIKISGALANLHYSIDSLWLTKSIVSLPVNLLHDTVKAMHGDTNSHSNILIDTAKLPVQIGRGAGKIIKNIFKL